MLLVGAGFPPLPTCSTLFFPSTCCSPPARSAVRMLGSMMQSFAQAALTKYHRPAA